ncbi:MAG: Rieske 2Fe-2S domain-containing protein [Bacteroidales bacterium]
MAENPIIDLIGRQQWLGWLGDRVAPLVRRAFAAAGVPGQRTKDVLHGTWLGHPLHPVLTDIPVGAWTAAAVFDAAAAVSPNVGLDRAASGAILVGLAGAVGSAVTGLTDWSETDGRARRIGLLHGVLNLTATGFYVASLVDRSRDRTSRGRLFGWLGYLIAGSSAYLGGALVYTDQIGVDHAYGQDVPEEFTRVAEQSEVQEGRPKRVLVADVPVVLVRERGRFYALADRCAHLGGPLSEGTLEDGTIACPWHGSRYKLEDGSVVNGPTTHPQPRYEVRVREGHIEIRMPSEQPEIQQAGAEGERKAG